MARKDNNFFRVSGAKEIATALDDLSRGTQNRIVRPGLTQAIAEVRKVAKTLVVVKKGRLKKAIQSKVITAKGVKSKGVVGKIGVLSKKITDGIPTKKFPGGTPAQLYGAVVNEKTRFLERANTQAKPAAVQKLRSVTKQKLEKFQSDMNAKANAAKGKK